MQVLLYCNNETYSQGFLRGVCELRLGENQGYLQNTGEATCRQISSGIILEKNMKRLFCKEITLETTFSEFQSEVFCVVFLSHLLIGAQQLTEIVLTPYEGKALSQF